MINKILNLLATSSMIFYNYKFGRNIGAVSDANFDNIAITPEKGAFKIWIIIYLYLAFYSIKQFILIPSSINESIRNEINFTYIISCILNILWIYFFSKGTKYYINLSIIVLFLLRFVIENIYNKINKKEDETGEKSCYSDGFTIYFAWLIIASLLNIRILIENNNIEFADKENIDNYLQIFIIGLGMGYRLFKKTPNFLFNGVFALFFFFLYNKNKDSKSALGFLTNIFNSFTILIKK